MGPRDVGQIPGTLGSASCSASLSLGALRPPGSRAPAESRDLPYIPGTLFASPLRPFVPGTHSRHSAHAALRPRDPFSAQPASGPSFPEPATLPSPTALA